MDIYSIKKYRGSESGYTLLFAVLVTSIVLSVALSILSISKKEFLLSSSARESQYAFYAADSGLECASYYDFLSPQANSPFFSTSTRLSTDPKTYHWAEIYCGSTNEIVIRTPDTDYSAGATDYNVTYTFSFGLDNGACSTVEVKKTYKKDAITSDLYTDTRIISRGYNAGWQLADATYPDIGNCKGVSTKKVERKLILTRLGH